MTRAVRRLRARAWRAAAVLALASVLVACASRPTLDRVGWQPVDGIDPAAVSEFRVAGRLAVSDGRDGGSAGFLWIQRGDRFDVELRQPVSQRLWRLHGDQHGAVLEGADDGPRRAASAEALLDDVLGWRVPVAALVHWVRARTGSGPVQASERDRSGRLRWLEQDGWRVDYRAYLDDGPWPQRIHARQADYSVRMNIQDWAVGR